MNTKTVLIIVGVAGAAYGCYWLYNHYKKPALIITPPAAKPAPRASYKPVPIRIDPIIANKSQHVETNSEA